MFDILEDLKFVISLVFCIVTGLIIIAFSIWGLLAGLNYTGYYLNKANCIAKVDKTVVYNGSCHFISLNSIGENGNTKVLKVYKDKAGFILLKKYVNDNITITESEE